MIVVVAADAQLDPLVRLRDSSGQWSEPGAEVTVQCGGEVTVGGGNFGPGSLNLCLDSAAGTVLESLAIGDDGGFTTTIDWPMQDSGKHQILGVQGTATAAVDVYGMPAPH